MNELREQRNTDLENGVARLVQLESDYATAEYGAYYNSPAEGFAIIREELFELTDDLEHVSRNLAMIDDATRDKNALGKIRDAAARLSYWANEAAIEAVHVAAAANKMVKSIDAKATRFFESAMPEKEESKAPRIKPAVPSSKN